VVLEGTARPEQAGESAHEIVARAVTDAGPELVTSWRSAFEGCLAAHLDKIRAVGPEHRHFVDTHFTPALRDILSLRVEGLIKDVEQDGHGHELELSRQSVHYTLCVLPERIEGAADWFQRQGGGYANRLVSLLDTWAGSGRQCEAVCVITFGMRDEAWISVTIVPARDAADSVEVMSFEFLSEEERRRALSLDIVSVGPVT